EFALGEIVVSAHQVVDGLHIRVVERIEPDHPLVAVALEVTVRIEDVSHATAHPGGEIAPGLSEDDDEALGHVFAAMVADALDDRRRAAVADREAFAGEPTQEYLPAGCAVQRDVADDGIVLGDERRLARWHD